MTIRLFAALAMPDEIAEPLLAQQQGVPGAKWRTREHLHLTLRYFGEVSEPVADDLDAALDEIAARARPFTLQLKGAGWFGGADPHALWVGAEENPALIKLAADCERAARRAGLNAEPRKFAPHVTMAYLKGAGLERVRAFEQRLGLYQSRPFEIDRIGLYSSWIRKSAPSLYRLEADYVLRG
jgi:2'-5' RNA ligase